MMKSLEKLFSNEHVHSTFWKDITLINDHSFSLRYEPCDDGLRIRPMMMAMNNPMMAGSSWKCRRKSWEFSTLRSKSMQNHFTFLRIQVVTWDCFWRCCSWNFVLHLHCCHCDMCRQWRWWGKLNPTKAPQTQNPIPWWKVGLKRL